ncbi:MAG: exo-alpha-sialidase, partial [Candidatus Latescibacteria bacterium]|nr:exo-alpha-sialidase [Candidatus Latescibacterota bacterium]
TSNEEDWTFVGVPQWKQDQEGVLYPPVWSYPNFDPDPTEVPNYYAHELAREDYAFLASQPLEDTDISVDHKCPYGAVIHGGIVFRAVDSVRCYVLELVDMGRKAQAYELILWVQDAGGYRREVTRGRAPHSVVPDRINQTGPTSRAEWYQSTPDWVTVRVQASGTYIRVSMDGRIVFEVRDRTYAVGCVGLVARGAVTFRNLRVEGLPGKLPEPWEQHEEEVPRFFYPGGEQPEGFNAFPVVCHTEEGVTLVAWSHAPKLTDPSAKMRVVLTRSEDEGRTWSRPEDLFSLDGHNCRCTSLFAHRDGSVSCLLGGQYVEPVCPTVVIRSSDNGRSWSDPEPFIIAGEPLSGYRGLYGRLFLYSPMVRMSDGTVVMCGYEERTAPGGTSGGNADLLSRAMLLRSTDDGITWEEPIPIDARNSDHNECTVAETEPGRMVAFMRTARAPYMWISISEDCGVSWTSLVQSDISAECPYLQRHRSGALILVSRGYGTFFRLSFDGGHTWSRTDRISPASAMIGMTEMADGRVLIVMHEGYRLPGNIRGQFFRITPDGPMAAD